MPTGLDVMKAADSLLTCLRSRIEDPSFQPFKGSMQGFELELTQARNRVPESATGSAVDAAVKQLERTNDACGALSPDQVSVTAFGIIAEDVLRLVIALGALELASARTRPMSSLQGALRMSTPRVRARLSDHEAVLSTTSETPEGGDANYYNKLITLFPAEALTLYGTGVAIFGRSTLPAILVCLAILVTLRWIANTPKSGGRTEKVPVVVAAMSFLFWTTATDPVWARDLMVLSNEALEQLRKWAAFLGAAFVLLAPAFVWRAETSR